MKMKSIEFKRLVKLGWLAVILPALVLSSCNKDDDDESSSSETAMTEEEAAVIVENSISDSSGGIEEQVYYACNHIVESIDTASCNMYYMTYVSGTNPSGTVVTYDLDYSWSRLLSCSNGSPQYFQFEYSGDLVYDAPRMSSDDEVSGYLTFSGLDDSSPTWVVSESYTKSGTQNSKVRANRSFNTNIQITFENITVNKTTYQIESGSGVVMVSGSTNLGLSYTHDGNIVFNGDQTATLTWSTGVVYDMNL